MAQRSDVPVSGQMMPGPSEAVEQDTHPVREAAKVAAMQAEESGPG